MNILMISRGYPSNMDPQWGCFEKDQAIALRNKGHNVSIISIDHRVRGVRKPYITHYTKDGFEIYDAYIFPSFIIKSLSPSLFYLFYSYLLKIIIKKYNIINSFKPDLIYAHYLTNIAISVPLKKKYNLPLVGIEHWSKVALKKLSKNTKQLGNIGYNNVNSLISVSKNLNLNIKKNFNHDSFIIPNMLGEEFVQNKLKTKIKGKIKLVSVGSLFKVKGFDILIEALKLLKEKNQHWEMVIIGEGPQRKFLEKQIDSYGLNNFIKLPGKKSRSEIIEVLNESDIYIQPSRSENFSVAILEALSCGLPSIVSDCGSARECINKNNGIIFPINDVSYLVNSILYIIQNLTLYHKETIRKEILDKYSPETISNTLSEIFELTLIKQKNE